MFDPNLVTTDGTTPKTYSLQSIVDAKSIRANAAAAVGAPETLTISHGKRNPKDSTSADRHLVRFDTTKVDSTSGVSQLASVYLVIEMPESQFTSTDIIEMFHRLEHIIVDSSAAGLLKILNNEP